MGQHDINTDEDISQFTQALLADIQALSLMLEQELFETGVRRIGAEQEMFLVDRHFVPSASSDRLLPQLPDPRFSQELARYNLEINLTPQLFTDTCLSQMESELLELMTQAHQLASLQDNHVILAGILPTLERHHLSLDNMSPSPRYFAMNEKITSHRGSNVQIAIEGVDELNISYDTVMLESCNASFQLHAQVNPDEFAPMHNISQLISAPVLALAANSPLLMGRRLWQETRIALFQLSVDNRSRIQQERGHLTRVHFGNDWLDESIIEVFKQDIANFRVILTCDVEDDPETLLKQGKIPKLQALALHNGTVWRWNRPCYGVTNGKPHLRIENRILPSGPTVQDEMANSAFFFGLLYGLRDTIGDPRQHLNFTQVKENFLAAARYGLQAHFNWLDGQYITAYDLILKQLLPQAEAGLKAAQIAPDDISRYLGILEARVSERKTGSQWMLGSYENLKTEPSQDLRQRVLTRALLKHQLSGLPVHEWPLAQPETPSHWQASFLQVGQIMTPDPFTLNENDVIDLAASIMDWQHIHDIPIENEAGYFVGLVTHADLLRYFVKNKGSSVAIRDIMQKEPATISPETSTMEAIQRLQKLRINGLPVIQERKLVGIITSTDLMHIAARFLEDYQAEKQSHKTTE